MGKTRTIITFNDNRGKRYNEPGYMPWRLLDFAEKNLQNEQSIGTHTLYSELLLSVKIDL